MLADDLSFKPLLDSLAFPVATGVWPVAHYDTPGNGSALVEFTVNGQRVVGRALHVGRGPHNATIFPDSTQRDEVVAVIMVRTDTPDEEHRSIAISRNHPDYLAEGRFTTAAGNVDWITMQLAERRAYAIVNMQLFDLLAGRVILIDPQADGSLRFLQRAMPLRSQAQVEGFVAELAKDPGVQRFFR